MTAEYLSLLLADGRLPTGAHTQSAGAEPAFQHGLRLEQIPHYVAVRLRTLTEVEAAAAVVARSVWSESARPGYISARPGDQIVRDLAEVDAAWRARSLSDALREASDLLGRGYLRLASRLWDLSALAGRTWCRAVVVGAAAAEAGLDGDQTARLVAYEDVQTVIAAALKLRPFDPALGVSWAMAAGVPAEALVTRVGRLSSVDQIPAVSAPLIEQWAQLHARTERRLFRA